MRTSVLLLLVFAPMCAFAQTAVPTPAKAPTATFGNEVIKSTPSEIGANDVDFGFDMRNDASAPIATVQFQCFLRLPDRKPPVASMKAQYTFQHVVQPGEVRHEDLVINPYSDMGQAAQTLIKGESFDCHALAIVTADGQTVLADAH